MGQMVSQDQNCELAIFALVYCNFTECCLKLAKVHFVGQDDAEVAEWNVLSF